MKGFWGASRDLPAEVLATYLYVGIIPFVN